jgi:hypothetical protein
VLESRRLEVVVVQLTLVLGLGRIGGGRLPVREMSSWMVRPPPKFKELASTMNESSPVFSKLDADNLDLYLLTSELEATLRSLG